MSNTNAAGWTMMNTLPASLPAIWLTFEESLPETGFFRLYHLKIA